MNKYERIRIVGRGAFGTVHLARRLSDNRSVIIKEIPVEQLNKIDRQATVNEVNVLAMLDHPNIIHYFESFIHDQAMMIVMEYASGGTLYELLESRSTEQFLEETDIAHLFAQMVLPLKLVHSRNILHRDLKSQNIFLTGNKDRVKIGDFGISKILSSKSKAYTVVGTPCYISPELCEGKPYNQKSDIWALGCILYEMCSLQRAFEAPTLPALVMKIMRGTFKPVPTHYSLMLKDLLASLLAVDPSQRPELSQIIGHPWLAPHLYRLPMTLGLLLCKARPQRPMTVTRFSESFNSSTPYLQNPGKAAPFRRNSKTSMILVWPNVADDPMTANISSVSYLPQAREHEFCAVHMISSNQFMAITRSGKVLEYSPDTIIPRHIENITGLSIVLVAVGGLDDSERFFFFLTDRGILLSHGKGHHGCLGHGDFEEVKKPKIVEALLGDEVVHVSCGDNHVSALTSEKSLFSWGYDIFTSDSEIRNVKNVPKLIDLDILAQALGPLSKVISGPQSLIALSTSEGQIAFAGPQVHSRIHYNRSEKHENFIILHGMNGVTDITFVGINVVIVVADGGRSVFALTANRPPMELDLAEVAGKDVIVKAVHGGLSKAAVKFALVTILGDVFLVDVQNGTDKELNGLHVERQLPRDLTALSLTSINSLSVSPDGNSVAVVLMH